MKKYKATLKKSEIIALETKFFHFELDKESQDFEFTPGQFISIKVADKTFRAYSICSTQKELPNFELVVKLIKDGIGSNYLNNLKKEDCIDFMGPFGTFVLHKNERKKILIATGAGIAPMRSIWKTILNEKNPEEIYLFFGFRHEENGIFMNELEKLQKKHLDKFFVKYGISQPKTNKFAGKECRITKLISDQPKEFFENADIYICGSKAMGEEVLDILLKQKKVDKNHIDAEYY